MSIQHIGQGAVQNALRSDFSDAALGRVGNLAFRGEPGATPRASKPGILQRIAGGISNAIAHIKSSPQQRARKQVVDMAREVSRRTADALGAMTARPGDVAGQQRCAAKLVNLAQSLARLPGDDMQKAGPALDRHLRSMSLTDLTALRSGLLSNPADRAAVLDHIEAGPLRDQAAGLLYGIGSAVTDEINRRAVGEPMGAAINALNARPADMAGLQNALQGVTEGVGLLKDHAQTRPDFLAACMLNLDDAQLAVLVRRLSADNIANMQGGLHANPQQAQAYADLLGDLQIAAGDRAQARLAALTDEIAGKLNVGVSSGGDVPAMHDRLVDEVRQQGGPLGGNTSVLLLQALARSDAAVVDLYIGKLGLEAVANLNGALAQVDGAVAGVLRGRIEAARDAHLQALGAKVDTLSDGMRTATDGGHRSDALMKLAELNEAVNVLRVDAGKFGQAVPEDLAARLRDNVGHTVDMLRAPSNPDGPLTRDSLADLADREFGLVRQARGELGDYGVHVDRQAVQDEVQDRRAGVLAEGQRQTVALMREMARDGGDARAVAAAVRGIASQAVAQMHLRAALGEEVGSDDRGRITDELVNNALEELRPEGDDVLARVVQGFAKHGGPLSDALPEMTVGVAMLSGTRDDQVRISMEQLAEGVNVGSYVMTSLGRALEDEAQRMGVEMPAGNPGAPLGEDMRAALRGEFGVDLDPVGTVTTPLSDASRALLVRTLETPIDVSVHPTDQVQLQVHGATRTFPVSHTFNVDAVDRTGTSFTVKGQGANGNVHEQRLQPGMSKEERTALLGPSLVALEQVAGGATEALTRIINQQLAGAVSEALMQMGGDSPLKTADGVVVIPGGAGYVHCDVERLPDGEFKLSVNVHYANMASGTGIGSDGNAVPVILDPATSEVRVTLGLTVSADGGAIRVTEMPQFQARLDTV